MKSRKYKGAIKGKPVSIFAESESQAKSLLEAKNDETEFIGKAYDPCPKTFRVLHVPTGVMLDYRSVCCVLADDYQAAPHIPLCDVRAILLDTRSSAFNRDGNRSHTFAATGLDKNGNCVFYIISDLFHYNTSSAHLRRILEWVTGVDSREVLDGIQVYETESPCPVPVGKLHCRDGRRNILNEPGAPVYKASPSDLRFSLT